MPLIFEQEINPTKKLGVWEITEDPEFFIQDSSKLNGGNGSVKRALEQAASLKLIQSLTLEESVPEIYRDANGKPHFKNQPWELSLSHSKQMIACIIDKSGRPAGVDIELIRDSIGKLAPKFVSENDSTPFKEGPMHEHLIWGAKEVLYKIHSRKSLDFKSHLNVIFYEKLEGKIKKYPHSDSYLLDFKQVGNFLLVWNF